ncbi:hypothetical protein KDM87_11755, partial [Undibacterium sp. FT147W]
MATTSDQILTWRSQQRRITKCKGALKGTRKIKYRSLQAPFSLSGNVLLVSKRRRAQFTQKQGRESNEETEDGRKKSKNEEDAPESEIKPTAKREEEVKKRSPKAKPPVTVGNGGLAEYKPDDNLLSHWLQHYHWRRVVS